MKFQISRTEMEALRRMTRAMGTVTIEVDDSTWPPRLRCEVVSIERLSEMHFGKCVDAPPVVDLEEAIDEALALVQEANSRDQGA